jgi:hypothetical protein
VADERMPRRRKRRDESVTRKPRSGDRCTVCEGTGKQWDVPEDPDTGQRGRPVSHACTHCGGTGIEP